MRNKKSEDRWRRENFHFFSTSFLLPLLNIRGRCLGFRGLQWSCSLAGYELLVEVSDLQADYGLEEAGPVVAAVEVGVLQHLLSDFAVELGGDVAEMALNVD